MANTHFALRNGPESEVPATYGTEDGITWPEPLTLTDVSEAQDIAFDGDSTVIVVRHTAGGNPNVYPIQRSIDNGQSFVSDTIGLTDQIWLFTVSWGLDLFFAGGFNNVAVGLGILYTSSGNGTWTPRSTPFASSISSNEGVFGSHFSSYNSTMLIGGTLSDNNGGISISLDGTTWSANKTNTFNGGGAFSPAVIRDFANNGVDTIIAVGNRSSAGNTIAHGQRSVDGGNTWSDMTFNSFGGAASIALAATYGNGAFLVCGNDMTNQPHLERSIDDGVTWSNIDVSDIFSAGFDIRDIKWSESLGLFILGSSEANFPLLATSPIGLAGSWTVISLTSPLEFSGIVAIAVPQSVIPPTPDEPVRETLVRDPWDIDEWGRFYPGAGFHKIT